MPESGEVLAGRYRLIEPLGQGGMGTVWRAEHVELGSEVAVKLIAEGVAQGETTLNRFKREAKAAAALASPHVVQIFDYGVDENRPYIAMELLKGESLAHRLKVRRTLGVEQTAELLTQIAKAMDKAHKAGILHRDLKPDNVFICLGDDEDETVKILDFGVAKALKPDLVGNLSSHTRTGALVGSPFYMSPEQIRGQKTIDHHGDLWSIGVMVYECLIGKRPFEGESLGDLVMTVCSDPIPVPSERGCKVAGFDGWFAKACARPVDERFQSGREMANAFRALLGQGVMDEETRDSTAEGTPASARATERSEVFSPPMVPTADGLSRTQDERRPVAGRQSGKALLVAAGVGLLATAIALLGVLAPWSGGGADPAAAAGSATAAPTSAPSATAAPVPTVTQPTAPTSAAPASSASASAQPAVVATTTAAAKAPKPPVPKAPSSATVPAPTP